jgi:hypothetical protein
MEDTREMRSVAVHHRVPRLRTSRAICGPVKRRVGPEPCRGKQCEW